MHGYVGDTAALKEPYGSNPANPLTLEVEHEDGRVVPTLIGRLGSEGFRYYLWLELFANRGFTGGSGPAVLLHAFDPIAARDV